MRNIKIKKLMPVYGLLLLLTACGNGTGEKKTSPTPTDAAAPNQEPEKCSALRINLREIDRRVQSFGVTFSRNGDTFRTEKTTYFYAWDPTSKYPTLDSFLTKVNELLNTCIDRKNPSNEDLFFYYKATQLVGDRDGTKRVLDSRNPQY